MLRSTLKSLKQFYRPLSGMCGKPATEWATGVAASGRLPQKSQGCKFSTDDFDCVQIDCQQEGFQSFMNNSDSGIFSTVEESKPEVVFLEHMQEADFWTKIHVLMRNMGYTGSFEDSRHGRVKGVFIRNDLVDPRGHSGVETVYKSGIPDPL